MKKIGPRNQLRLTSEETGYLAQGLSFANRPFRPLTADVRTEYALGPRGASILQLISSHQVIFPLDLTNFYRIGRSLITAELTRLTDAQLITYRKSNEDRRRVELTLTPLGVQVAARVREAMTNMIRERFSGYTREEVLKCAHMLHDFILGEPVSVKSPVKTKMAATRQPADGKTKRRRPARSRKA